jgi:hypothetical protein
MSRREVEALSASHAVAIQKMPSCVCQVRVTA